MDGRNAPAKLQLLWPTCSCFAPTCSWFAMRLILPAGAGGQGHPACRHMRTAGMAFTEVSQIDSLINLTCLAGAGGQGHPGQVHQRPTQGLAARKGGLGVLSGSVGVPPANATSGCCCWSMVQPPAGLSACKLCKLGLPLLHSFTVGLEAHRQQGRAGGAHPAAPGHRAITSSSCEVVSTAPCKAISAVSGHSIQLHRGTGP